MKEKSMINIGYAREKVGLAQSKFDLTYNQPSMSQQNKDVLIGAIQRKQQEFKQKAEINKQEEKIKKAIKEKYEKVYKKVDKFERASIGEKTFSKKILKKPTVSVPKYSAVKAVKALASQQGALVRQVEPREIVQDNRSLYFREELNGEAKRERSWLFK